MPKNQSVLARGHVRYGVLSVRVRLGGTIVKSNNDHSPNVGMKVALFVEFHLRDREAHVKFLGSGYYGRIRCLPGPDFDNSSLLGPNELPYNRYARKSGRGGCIYADDSRSFRRYV